MSRSLHVALHPSGTDALERTLFGSLRSGRHSIGDDKLRQEYGWKYAALQTCPEGSIFPAVFRCIITCSILQVDTGRAHTFSLNTSFGQRTPSLAAVATCSWSGRNICGCCSAPSSHHRFAAKWLTPWRRRTTESLRACVGRETEPMVGRLWLPSQCNCAYLPAASVAMPVLHHDIAVIRDGSAFSTRVQRAALFNRRGLLLWWTCTVLNVRVGFTGKWSPQYRRRDKICWKYDRNTAGNTAQRGSYKTTMYPLDMSRRAAYFLPTVFRNAV